MRTPGSISVQDEAGVDGLLDELWFSEVCWRAGAPAAHSPTEPMLLGTPGPGLPHGLVGVALTVR